MIKTFHCPNCHASLDHDTDQQTVSCPYCNTTVVVPEELRSKSADASSRFEVYDDNSMAVLLEITKLVRNGKFDDAAFLYEEAFDMSPAAARQAVQQMSMGGGTTTTILTTPTYQRRGGGGAGFMMVLVILVGVLVYSGYMMVQSQPELLEQLPPEVASLIGEVAPDMIEEIEQILPTPIPGFADVTLAFGEEGNGPGRFTDPRHIGVDAEGMIYTADWEGGRVQVFQPDGTFVTSWMADVDGDEDYIESMAVSRQGIIFLQRIRTIFAYEGSTGELLYQVELDENAADLFANIDGGFSVYLNSPIQDFYVRYDAQGNEVERIPNLVSNYDDDFVFFADQLVLDGANNIYILHPEALLKFGPEGNFINRISSEGDAEDQLRNPNALAADGRGRLYVSDFRMVKVFDGDGRFIKTFPYPENGSIFFNMVITDDDQIIAMDRNNNQVVIYQINE